MDIVIKKLLPDMAEEYICFFDETPHDDGIPDHTCYCVNWCSENQRGRVEDPLRDERRKMATEYIQNGTLQGYLAYVDGKIVGWCNANTKTKCLDCFGWYHFMMGINELPVNPSEKVKSIFCFMITPYMKRKGIATKLLEYICEDAKKDGFSYLEAYPQKQENDEYQFYVGFKSLYEKMGFTYYTETEQKYIMRKKLNG